MTGHGTTTGFDRAATAGVGNARGAKQPESASLAQPGPPRLIKVPGLIPVWTKLEAAAAEAQRVTGDHADKTQSQGWAIEAAAPLDGSFTAHRSLVW